MSGIETEGAGQIENVPVTKAGSCSSELPTKLLHEESDEAAQISRTLTSEVQDNDSSEMISTKFASDDLVDYGNGDASSRISAPSSHTCSEVRTVKAEEKTAQNSDQHSNKVCNIPTKLICEQDIGLLLSYDSAVMLETPNTGGAPLITDPPDVAASSKSQQEDSTRPAVIPVKPPECQADGRHSESAGISDGQHVVSSAPNPPVTAGSNIALSDITTRQQKLISELDRRCEVDNHAAISGSSEFKELKQLCQHLQAMLEQQLVQQERLQEQNERLARQVTSLSTQRTAAGSSDVSREKTVKTALETQQAARIVVLETTSGQLQKEVDSLKATLSSQTTKFKQDLNSFQSESKSKLEQLTRQYEECRREKESMVVRYAQAEQRNIELQSRAQKAELQMKDWAREREVAVSRWNMMRSENVKTMKNFEAQVAELSSLKREVEHQKELASSAEVQAKFHQNRLREEMEKHKETRTKLEENVKNMEEVFKDLELIGQEIHSLNVFLEAQQVAGFPMSTPQIKDTLSDLVERQQNCVKHEACLLVLKEVACVILRQKDLTEELVAFRDKIRQLESERQLYAIKAGELETQLNGTGDLLEQLAELEGQRTALHRFELQVLELSKSKAELEQVRDDLLVELESHRQREAESLEFTQRMTIKNSQLQSENLRLTAESQPLQSEIDRLLEQVSGLQHENKALLQELSKVKESFEQERDVLSKEVSHQQQIADEMRLKSQELDDEIKTINRRHASSVKDLMRQLQSANRRLEAQDVRVSGTASDHDSDSASSGSRVGSATQIGSRVGSATQITEFGGHLSASSSHNSYHIQEDTPPVVKVVEIDRQMLFDKIVSLQKTLARKNEKLDFLEDHINHLVEDINKKHRIIQKYLLSQEAGALSSERSDKVKAALAKKGGVMASLYNAQCQDGHGMSVELALEISNKLQAVLEDTLLKNITLKENMDTLGEQVAALMLENRCLKEKCDAFQTKRH